MAKNTNTGKTCFIIMPFSQTEGTEGSTLNKEELEYIYTNVIKEAVSQYKVKSDAMFTEIARYESNFGSIIDGVIDKLNDSDLVIADLTGLNPNVMYELGVRHTLKRGTIIISQEVQKLPSDLRDYICIQYNYSNSTVKQKENYVHFCEQLHKAISELFSGKKHDSPVLAYLSQKQKFWAEDEVKKVKENIVVWTYIVEQYDEIKKMLEIASAEQNMDRLKLHFNKLSALLGNLAIAMQDINISIQQVILYEDILAAKQLIGEIQRKFQMSDWVTNYFAPLAGDAPINFEAIKFAVFNDKFLDYFKLAYNEYGELSLTEIFNDEGDFYKSFVEELSEYLERKAIELGITPEEIDYMQTH